MVTLWKLCQVHVVVLSLVILNFVISSTNAQPFDYPIANLSNSWTNNPSIEHSVDFQDGSKVRSILLRGSFGPRFACGFYCNGNCTFFLFAIFIVQTNSASLIVQPSIGFPQVVWSSNRNNPVRENATLQLTKDGDLVLRDVDGTLVWSTNTTGQSVVGLNITEIGNLILYDRNNRTVWQSFEHPTDSLVPGQSLLPGQKLTASVSSLNSAEGGLLSLSVTTEGLVAYIESNPLQSYYESGISGTTTRYVNFMNGSIAIFTSNSAPNQPFSVIPVPVASSAQYIKFDSDGHLKVFEWSSGWKEVADLLTGYLGNCKYPLVCGSYGICSNEQCGCPGATGNEESYFRLINNRQPNSGCVPITPLSCESPQDHKLLDLNDATYFYFPANITNTDIESCKQACLKNCSCKASLFRYGENVSNGECFLPSQLFSLMNNEKDKTHYNSSAFIKVQVSRTEFVPPTSQPKSTSTGIILGSSLGALSGILLIIGVTVVFFRIKKASEEKDEEYLDQVPGMATRFTYEELKVATTNFLKKLGQGGFGSVFEGTLVDGSKVAVKCLDGIGQVKKSFLAEVETIGSIHHVNLVRLVGFSADKSHRLLVYEYMSNGSLEKWIFNQNHESSLSWQTRRKIILDVAKGLTYLHEECRQKIFHLDNKPQNILLDNSFNAKVSDFGLSKLIDKDQSQVMTTMRGTRGYLAPEWLNSIITEKVDVYSFGVVVLEIVCGRKNLDYSQPEETMHLLSVLKTKAEEDRLSDMVDENSEDMLVHKKEVVEMIKIAVWCLQSDYTKRPSMSVVVKVIEGLMEVELNLDYTFSTTVTPTTMIQQEAKFGSSTPLLASVLSGPR